MDVSFCIVSAIFMLFYAIPSVILVIKAIIEFEGWYFFAALVFFINAIIPGCLFFQSLDLLSSPPIISSCTPIVTTNGDTIYEFRDASRYCESRIEENDTSVVFTIRKESSLAGLHSTDSCVYCHRQLRVHSKKQRIGSSNNLDYDWIDIPY